MKKFSDRVRLLRGGLSQAKAAEMIGCTQQAWARIESGKGEPNAKTVRQLCLVFHTTADWILGLSDDFADRETVKTPSESDAARIVELEKENAELRGRVAGLQYALSTVNKGGEAVSSALPPGVEAHSAA